MESFAQVHRAPNLAALALLKCLLDIFSGMSARLSNLIDRAIVSANAVLPFLQGNDDRRAVPSEFIRRFLHPAVCNPHCSVLSDDLLDGGGYPPRRLVGSFRSRLDLDVEFAHQAAAFRRWTE